MSIVLSNQCKCFCHNFKAHILVCKRLVSRRYPVDRDHEYGLPGMPRLRPNFEYLSFIILLLFLDYLYGENHLPTKR